MKDSLNYRLRMLMLPGLKRWIAVILFGILSIVLGVFLLLGFHPLTVTGNFLREVMEQGASMVHYRYSGIIVITGGAIIVCLAIAQMTISVLGAYLPSDRESIPDVLYRKRHLGRGPKVVVIGGGTGLSNLLKGIKNYTNNITAIVTVGDDGGSSGRLRQELGVLPPGDIRNCITALADEERLVTELFRYRFESGKGLEGHNFGNLFLTAIWDMTRGDMLEGVRVASRVLNSCGMVLPSTLTSIQLVAEMQDGRIVRGESQIPKADGQIKRLQTEPVARAIPEALEAIADADLIILGPGSLYTSIIPNLLVQGVPEAIRQAKARKLYVCNVMTQLGETVNYSVADHLEALLLHAEMPPQSANKLVQTVLVNDQLPSLRPDAPISPVYFDADRVRALGIAPLRNSLVSEAVSGHHDSTKLANEVMTWFFNQKSKRQSAEASNNTGLYQRVASFFSI
jgi:uncharacterized cofD-like protein